MAEQSEQSGDLKKLVSVATDLGLSIELRTKAIKLVGGIRSHDALLALLGFAASDKLTKGERELAVKYAREIIKAGN